MSTIDDLQPIHDNFDSPFLLLNNGRDNFDKLAKCISDYIKSHPFEDVLEENPEKNSQIHKLRLTQQVPTEIRILTRDIIRDLRDSLDHAMHSAAVTLNSDKPDKSAFVFSDNEDSYLREIRRNKGNPQQINKLLEEFSAYKGGNELLYGLSKLRNADTHRKIVALGSVPIGTVHVISYATGWPISFWDFEKSEYHYHVAPLGSKGKHHVEIQLSLIFKGTEYFDSRPVHEVISHLGEEVLAVVRAIEAETLKNI